MKELKKQHLEMLQLLESIEVMLQNGDSIHPNSVIRGAIKTAIGMDINLNNKKQTAVEYMYNIMFEKKGRISKEEFEQAKEMEKEQIELAHIDGGNNQRTAVKYYNETFDTVAYPTIEQLEQISHRDNPLIDRNLLLKFFKAGNDCGCMEHENIEDYFEQYFRL